MPPAHEPDKVATLLRDGAGAGGVIGARANGVSSCDIELITLSQVPEGYRLRSAVVDLAQINEVRDHLFTVPATFAAEDLTFPTLSEALRLADAIARSSPADPVSGLGPWQPASKLSKSLKRPLVRSQIPWLPQPPRWWNLTRRVLTMTWYAVALLLSFSPVALAIYWGWDTDSWAGVVVPFLPMGIGVLLMMTGEWADGLIDQLEPRLERHFDEPGVSKYQFSDSAPSTDTGDSRRAGPTAADGDAIVADSAPRPPAAFMVHGRRRIWYLIGWAAGAGAVAWFMTWPDAWGGDPPPRVWPFATLLVLASLCVAIRAFLRGVGAGAGGVRVVNLGRTHRIRWQDLRRISCRARYSVNDESVYALEFQLTSGSTVPATVPVGDRAPGGRLQLLRERIYELRDTTQPGMVAANVATEGKAQIITVHRQRLVGADAEVAVVIPLPDGRYRHRRMRCRGTDLHGGLAHLFDPHPAALIDVIDPSAPPGVLDRDFDTLDEALLWSAPGDLPPHLDRWLDEVEFCSWVAGSEFSGSIRPEGERVSTSGRVATGAVAVATLAATFYAGYRFNLWVGLDTAQTSGTLADDIYTIVLVVAAFALAGWSAARLSRALAQRHLRAEVATARTSTGTEKPTRGWTAGSEGPAAGQPVDDAPEHQ